MIIKINDKKDYLPKVIRVIANNTAKTFKIN